MNNYDREFSYNEKFKKIKKRINKNSSIKNISKTGVKEDNTRNCHRKLKKKSVFNKDFYKSSENNDENERANIYDKKIYAETDSKPNLFNKNNKIISKFDEEYKVVELFSRIKSPPRTNNPNYKSLINSEVFKSNNSDLNSLNKENIDIKKTNKDVIKNISNMHNIKTNSHTNNLIKDVEKDEEVTLQKTHSSTQLHYKELLTRGNKANSVPKRLLDKADKNILRRIQKKNNSVFIPFKIKIKKSDYDRWRKENYKSSDDTSGSLLFGEDIKEEKKKKKKNNVIKKEAKNTMKTNSLSSQVYINKKDIFEPKIEEKLIPKLLVQSRNTRDEVIFSNKNLKTYDLKNTNNVNNNNNIFNTNRASNYILESLKDEQSYVLNTYNKEKGELNNELYIKKYDLSEKEILGSEIEFISNNKYQKNIKTNNVNNQERLEKPEDILKKDLSNKKHSNENQKDSLNEVKFRNEFIKKGASALIGGFSFKRNLDIQEAWNRRKNEICKSSQIKINLEKTKNINKVKIFCSKIKSDKPSEKYEKKEKKNQLYYSIDNKNHFLTKSKSEIPDLKVNVSQFIKENFDRHKSIFNLNSNKDLLESSEVSKKIFIDRNKISTILNKKYTYIKNNCKYKSIEK